MNQSTMSTLITNIKDFIDQSSLNSSFWKPLEYHVFGHLNLKGKCQAAETLFLTIN